MAKSVQLAERLKTIRECLGKNQVEFAKLMEVTQPSVSGWESGDPDSSSPSSESFGRLGTEALKAGLLKDAIWCFQRMHLSLPMIGTLLEDAYRKKGSGYTSLAEAQFTPRQFTVRRLSSGTYAGKLGIFDDGLMVGTADGIEEEASLDAATELDELVEEYMTEHGTDRAMALREVSRRNPGLLDRLKSGE